MAQNAPPVIGYDAHSVGISRHAAMLGVQRRRDGLVHGAGNYCVVHWMLAPGARHILQTNIETRLAKLNGYQLHLRAWAVPLEGAGDENGALFVWEQLLITGGPEDPLKDPRHEWRAGDVIYLHYSTDRGSMASLACICEQDGAPLSQP